MVLSCNKKNFKRCDPLCATGHARAYFAEKGRHPDPRLTSTA